MKGDAFFSIMGFCNGPFRLAVLAPYLGPGEASKMRFDALDK